MPIKAESGAVWRLGAFCLQLRGGEVEVQRDFSQLSPHCGYENGVIAAAEGLSVLKALCVT